MRTREIIDSIFSLQWCRDNFIVPISQGTGYDNRKPSLTLAVGNLAYLASVGDFASQRAEQAGYECHFVQKSLDYITRELDAASNQRIVKAEGIEDFSFDDDAVLAALKAADGDPTTSSEFQIEFEDGDEVAVPDTTLDLEAEMSGSQIQRAAAQVLVNAIRNNVSDIHIEPREDLYKIRVRRDGVMQPYVQMPKSAGIRLTACLKNMAKMDIAERRASQDGKILARYLDERMEFRCSTAPGKNGEKMVLRILNSSTDMLSIDSLIDNEEVRAQLRSIISQPNGIIVVSGPTGSGKSTTLASVLRERDDGECNIVTAEDPIEYDLGGDIQQFQVLRAKGQTFAQLLRTFLRQDPDIILIGETRDPETAESSMDAAETGHLVFTTLHANSAASSLTRLMDMNVAVYKLTTSLRGVLAQRLMRKVCQDCSSQEQISPDEAAFSGLSHGTTVRKAKVLTAEEKTEAKDNGTLCPNCNGSGYRGRVGSYELMVMSKGIRDAIKDNRSSHEIEEIAVSEGMLTLKNYGVKLVEKKLTTFSELLKICASDN